MAGRIDKDLSRPPLVQLCVALLSLALLGGCGLAEKHRNNKVPHYGAYDPDQPRELGKTVLPPYTVEPPDELEISARPAALDFPLGTVQVRSDGVVDLGLYGEVGVTGLTIPDIEAKITSQVTAVARHRAITDPVEVSVRLVNGGRSKQYYVLGTVNAPGAYPISGNETVLDAIVKAGLRSHSLPDKAYLARPHPAGGADEIMRIDWERIQMGDTFTNYQLMPGDRVVVPGGRPPGLLQTLFGG